MKSNNNLQHELYDEYNLRFDDYSDTELVDAFNGQVGNGGSGTAKLSYLRAIKSQLIKREIDFSETVGYTKKVILKDKKMYLVENS
ncbi:MAG: hypothetical protein V7670_06460 [Maribacter arcticus]|uniref:hypothetical protein n=1 Tax=Maribacter arcticus TaxID=561365 RepID=UPI00300316EF